MPKGFVEKHLAEAKGATIYGVPLESLTRDELLACAVAGWQAHKDEIERQLKDDVLP